MQSQHFAIHELDEGVYAAIHREGGAAYSNAGIIDLGEQTLVFDTFDMAMAARDLLKASKELTGRSPSWVVNSHSHGDHWGGNQIFAKEAVILATHQTREDMLEWGEEIEEMKKDPGKVAAEIRRIEKKLLKEKDVFQRTALERNLARNRFLLADLPDFKFHPPTLTFNGRMTFHGSKRRAELVTTGPGHTPEECHLVLAKEKIIFTGDLAFFDCPPFMAMNCSVDGWLVKLEEFRNSGMKIFVPGHGRLGDKSDLQRQQVYLRAMRDLVAAAVEKGKTRAEVLQLSLPAVFEDWAGSVRRNENNLQTLYTQISKGK
jgi:cyclase